MADLGLVKDALELIRGSAGVAALLVGTGGVGGGVAGWAIRHWAYREKKFTRRLEIIGVEPFYQGGVLHLNFTTHGGQMNLDHLVGIKNLESRIARGARRTKDHILRLKNPGDHRLFMEILEEHITGPEPSGNMDALMGRTENLRVDPVSFCPTFHPEDDDSEIIRVYVIATDLLPKFANTDFCAKVVCVPSRYQYRAGILCDIAQELNSHSQKNGGTAAVWHTHVKTSGRVRTKELVAA